MEKTRDEVLSQMLGDARELIKLLKDAREPVKLLSDENYESINGAIYWSIEELRYLWEFLAERDVKIDDGASWHLEANEERNPTVKLRDV
jgi:hypothetical protein